MKTWRAAIPAVVAALAIATPAFADRGEVSHRIRGCSWFLIDAPTGFVLVEWYGGNDPQKSDEIVGEFNTYGMKTLFNNTADQEVRVWIDEFMLGKSDAIEKLAEKCE